MKRLYLPPKDEELERYLLWMATGGWYPLTTTAADTAASAAMPMKARRMHDVLLNLRSHVVGGNISLFVTSWTGVGLVYAEARCSASARSRGGPTHDLNNVNVFTVEVSTTALEVI